MVIPLKGVDYRIWRKRSKSLRPPGRARPGAEQEEEQGGESHRKFKFGKDARMYPDFPAPGPLVLVLVTGRGRR